MTRSFEIVPGIEVGESNRLLLMAGPCQIESLEHCLKVAAFLRDLCAGYPVNLVFKSSFDKANRTSLGGLRGPGIETGLSILKRVRKETGLPVVTDVHSAEQVHLVSDAVDILQTPAFLCRQTDLLLAAGSSGKPVHCKKGQFLAPQDMRFAAEKIASTGNRRVMLCERGSSFGYRDLVVDMRSLMVMRETGWPVTFDATHSVQSPGGADGASGGSRKFVISLACAAAAVGIDGLFVECHERPEAAPSDGACMLPLANMKELLDRVCSIRESHRGSPAV